MILIYDKLSIAWWNTSLSPSKHRDRTNAGLHQVVLFILAAMIKKYDLDIIALGEISPKDIGELKHIFDGEQYTLYDGSFTDSKTRIRHDICVIFNKNKLICTDVNDMTKPSHMGAIRAGHELRFRHIHSGYDLFLYVLHWPARHYDFSEHAINRYELGRTVRDAIEKRIREANAEYFIAIGDFNDEPFDDSIVKGLGATRDRSIVSSKAQLLYNPFWRHIGHQECLENHSDMYPWGTCYYRSDKFTKWKTFDQIIFSSSFIKNTHWVLREESVRVIHDFDLVSLVYNPDYYFDHLPVMATIESVSQ